MAGAEVSQSVVRQDTEKDKYLQEMSWPAMKLSSLRKIVRNALNIKNNEMGETGTEKDALGMKLAGKAKSKWLNYYVDFGHESSDYLF